MHQGIAVILTLGLVDFRRAREMEDRHPSSTRSSHFDVFELSSSGYQERPQEKIVRSDRFDHFLLLSSNSGLEAGAGPTVENTNPQLAISDAGSAPSEDEDRRLG